MELTEHTIYVLKYYSAEGVEILDDFDTFEQAEAFALAQGYEEANGMDFGYYIDKATYLA